MAKVLLTWELGGGYGHVGSLSAIATALRRRGHDVVAALKEPDRGAGLIRAGAVVRAIPPRQLAFRGDSSIATYADLLGSVGFADSANMQHILAGWDQLLDEVRPETVVFDHSPFAMLAASGRELRGIQHGTGFYIPPDVHPLPILRPWLISDVREAARRDEQVLRTVNSVLDGRGQNALERLGRLYSLFDNWLATYAELDHFGESRPLTEPSNSSTDLSNYRGITPPATDGWRAKWPETSGPKIFAYLQSDESSLAVVKSLIDLNYPTIVHLAGIDAKLCGFASPAVRLIGEPVALEAAATQCDLAILNGGHGTLATMLLAGKPVIIAPIQLEQLLVAKRCFDAGLGWVLPLSEARNLGQLVERCLSPPIRHTTEAFSQRYRGWNQQQALELFVDRVERLP